MRYGLLLASLLAALVAATSALAAPPAGDALPTGEDLPALVSGPTRIAPSEVPGLGAGPVRGAGAAKGTAGFGGYLITCWAGTARSGSSDWSGHVYIYQHLYWCGNGAVVTYATASQTYEQAGWYTLTNYFGPWWSGGCAGCAYQRVSGYILWNWHTALVNISHSGTTNLDTTMWASGGVTF
jgi:hypothetical protein